MSSINEEDRGWSFRDQTKALCCGAVATRYGHTLAGCRASQRLAQLLEETGVVQVWPTWPKRPASSSR